MPNLQRMIKLQIDNVQEPIAKSIAKPIAKTQNMFEMQINYIKMVEIHIENSIANSSAKSSAKSSAIEFKAEIEKFNRDRFSRKTVRRDRF